jgi:hypothetical protein
MIEQKLLVKGKKESGTCRLLERLEVGIDVEGHVSREASQVRP